MLKNTSPERKRSWIWSCWCESDVAASYAERANVNLTDRVSDGYPGVNRYYPVSPLKAAIRNNDLQMVKILVEAGANLNQADGGNTPLETAKDDKIKEYLILKGAK